MIKVTVIHWDALIGEYKTTIFEVIKFKQVHSHYMRELWVDLYLTNGNVQPIDLQNCEVIIEPIQ